MRLDHLLSKERAVENTVQEPRSVTGFKMLFNFESPLFRIGGVAQVGERLPCKQEARGSIPLISTSQMGS